MGGKSHGLDLAGATMGTADGDFTTGDGVQGEADEPKSIIGIGDQGTRGLMQSK